MNKKIRVAILEDHQSVIDGYFFRLGPSLDVEIVGVCLYGNELDEVLSSMFVDVLLLDLSVPISSDNSRSFPVRHELRKIFGQYPNIKVIVLSVFDQKALVYEMLKIGVSGYIVKDDEHAVKNLENIIKSVSGGGLYLSSNLNINPSFEKHNSLLTPRQLEALSLCVAFPDMASSVLAQKMDISSSTFRNILSGAYERLDVRTRNAAVKRAEDLGLVLQRKRKKKGMDDVWEKLLDI